MAPSKTSLTASAISMLLRSVCPRNARRLVLTALAVKVKSQVKVRARQEKQRRRDAASGNET